MTKSDWRPSESRFGLLRESGHFRQLGLVLKNQRLAARLGLAIRLLVFFQRGQFALGLFRVGALDDF